jgi:hypothetical protein
MAKPIPSLKRPSIPADIAERFIAAGPSAVVAPLPQPAPAPLSIVPEPAVAAPAADLEVEPARPHPEAGLEQADVAAPAVVVERKAPRARAGQSGRQLTRRANGEEVRKVTFYLPPELDTELSLHCVRNGLDRTDVVVTALKRIIKG